MDRFTRAFVALFLCSFPATAEVLSFASLTAPEVDRLDRVRTVVLIPGGILEEHGPYLPVAADGIFSERLTADLAAAISARPGWSVLVLPSIPLGAGAANEIGARYSFPGSVTVRPSTLRAIFMDLADQLGGQGFRWIFVVHGHGDPAHNRMLDEAGDYFRDTYAGSMVNVFGYVWAMPRVDFRTPEQSAADGLAEHATLTETSVILALRPAAVAPGFRDAVPQAGHTMEELQRIASAPGWPGYFGAPGLASPELGARIYGLWLERSKRLVLDVLAGTSIAEMPRYGTVYADDPADAAACRVNDAAEARHQAWLAGRLAPAPESPEP